MMTDNTPDYIDFEQAWDGTVDAGGHRAHGHNRISFEHLTHIGGRQSIFLTAADGQDTVHLRLNPEQARKLHAWLGQHL